MTTDLLHRIRWSNVARAAGVLVVAALVVAWPRLRSAPPGLPAAEPAAVVPEVPTRPAPRRAAAPRGKAGRPKAPRVTQSHTIKPRKTRRRPRRPVRHRVAPRPASPPAPPSGGTRSVAHPATARPPAPPARATAPRVAMTGSSEFEPSP